MSAEDSEMWRAHRQEQQANRAGRAEARGKALMELREEGFDVRALTPYQFRVNGRIDIYVVWGKYHDIKTGARSDIWDYLQTEEKNFFPTPSTYYGEEDFKVFVRSFFKHLLELVHGKGNAVYSTGQPQEPRREPDRV